jgi:multicomponent Na+:H+ antiporter subunit G
MEILRESSVCFCLVVGSIFCIIGGIGIIRMPDFYTRSHAAGITDTLGATLILLGLGIHAGVSLVAVKLVMVLFLIYVTSPTAAHALMKAAYSKGVVAPEVEDVTGPSPVLSDSGGEG